MRHADNELYACLHHRLQGNFGLYFVEGACNAPVRLAYRRLVKESEVDAAGLCFMHKPRSGRLHDNRKAQISSRLLGLLSARRELRIRSGMP